jgi:hypothetical protein
VLPGDRPKLVEESLAVNGSAKPGTLEEAFIVFLSRRERLQPEPTSLPIGSTDSEGRRNTADDLSAAIAEVSRYVHIIGLGLGKGTTHVNEFYPREFCQSDRHHCRVGTECKSAMTFRSVRFPGCEVLKWCITH